MKNIFKITEVFFVGIISAMIIYPLLHEVGHLLIAISIGVELVDFSVFPIPYIEINGFGINRIEHAAIGIGGILFPYLLSFVLKPKIFWCWYANFVVRIISLLAVFISFVCAILLLNDIRVNNEDIVMVMEILDGDYAGVVIILIVMLLCGIIRFIADKSFDRMLKYLH